MLVGERCKYSTVRKSLYYDLIYFSLSRYTHPGLYDMFIRLEDREICRTILASVR